MSFPVPDAQALAREALGDTAPSGLAEWLGMAAPDCPLVIVVAAALIRRWIAGSRTFAR